MIRFLAILCLGIYSKVLGQDDSQYCNISPSHTLCQYKVRKLEVPISYKSTYFKIHTYVHATQYKHVPRLQIQITTI